MAITTKEELFSFAKQKLKFTLDNPQNASNLFEVIYEIINALVFGGGSDNDWEEDSLNNYVYNTTDFIGIGTNSPVTEFNQQFSSVGIDVQHSVGNTPDYTLLGAPPGFAAPGFSMSLFETANSRFMYKAFGSASDAVLTPLVESFYRESLLDTEATFTEGFEGFEFDAADNLSNTSFSAVIQNDAISFFGTNNVIGQTIDIADDLLTIKGENFGVLGEAVNSQWSTNIGITHEITYPTSGLEALIELSDTLSGITSYAGTTAGAFAYFEILQDLGDGNPGFRLRVDNAAIPAYADDAAAGAAGIPIGGIYRTGSILKTRVI